MVACRQLTRLRPGYLTANMAGPQKYVGKPNSHFSPSSALFTAKQRGQIIWSDIGELLLLLRAVTRLDSAHLCQLSASFDEILIRVRFAVKLNRCNSGFFLALAGIVYASSIFGVGNVMFYYFLPYLVVNGFLVTITYLQHTDTYVPSVTSTSAASRCGRPCWGRHLLMQID